MDASGVTRSIEFIAKALEVAGVAVIAGAFVYAGVRSFLNFSRRRENAFERLKIFIGRALQLGLEFLVAADIIRTVTISPTRESILSLGLLIVIRTVLSWSITVEIEGCWPWQVAQTRKR